MKITLSTQLALLMMMVIMLLLSVSLVISFNASRQYVENQLVSHAQDAATSLGLSASSAVENNDTVTLRSLVGAMFHSGDYQKIQVYDINHQEIFSQQQIVTVEGIPKWFIDLLPLKLHIGKANMMNGWSQTGSVEVVSHPGYAYRQLWDTTAGLFQWFVAVALIVSLLSLLMLRNLLVPLKQVEQQSRAIVRREFAIIDSVPKTVEFRNIVLAMNQMSESISKMFQQSDALAQGLRDQLNRDSVTGLANKKYFYEILTHRLSPQTPMSQGVLALIQLKNFKKINQQYGYKAGDALLKLTSAIVKSALDDYENKHVARLSGADFAVFVEDMLPEQADKLGQKLADSVASLAEQPPFAGASVLSNINSAANSWGHTAGKRDIGHVGLCVFSTDQLLQKLLSQADNALRQAASKAPNSWFVAHPTANQTSIKTATQWQQYINQAFENDWFFIQRQPVFAIADKKVLHDEIYIRLAENGDTDKTVNAGLFMPSVRSMGLAPSLDRVVIEKTLQLLRADKQAHFAINLSASSLDDHEFLQWLETTLAETKHASDRLIFEFAEYAVINKLEQLTAFNKTLSEYGSSLALDHFGAGFSAFAYLQGMPLAYVKIDGSYFKDIDADKQKQFFVQAMVDIAHGLDITTIAESVETQQTWESLKALKLDAGQGYYLARPE